MDNDRGSTEHGVDQTFYDNLGEGWRMSCPCGFMTAPYKLLEIVAAEMDEHFEEPAR